MALVVALQDEARGVLEAGHWRRVAPSASQAAYDGRVGGVEAVLAVSGVGRARAEAAVREVLEERRPDAVLSLGFAGGLVDGQRVGDLVVARTLTPADGGHAGEGGHVGPPLRTDGRLADEALRVLAGLGLRHEAGACVTASHIVSDPDEKRRLGLRTGALAVEEESFWIGAACRERDVPFLAVRSIVDPVERPLPGFVASFALDSGLGSRWRHVLPVILRPWSIPAAVRLGGAASAARDSLTAFVVGFASSRTRVATW